MRDLNKVELLGSVSREIKMAQSAKGLSIANIPIATVVSRQSGSDIKTFHTIVCFGELADMASTFVVGDRVFISGSVQNESYEKNGQKVYVTKIKASHLAKLMSEAEDKPPGGETKKEESAENFPLGEVSSKPNFPFYDAERKVTWDKPGDSKCSPCIVKDGINMTCQWESMEDPSLGAVVFGMKDGDESWKEIGTIKSTVDIPF
tara:strand:- start:1053 stop:1667 length:615 start_codon:yes stop_codon:yes gene_type:complete